MQYPLVGCPFCLGKRVFAIDILIKVSVKETRDWMDPKTGLPVQLQKGPLQGRRALPSGMGELRSVCLVQGHVFMQSEFVMGHCPGLLLYLAENLYFQTVPRYVNALRVKHPVPSISWPCSGATRRTTHTWSLMAKGNFVVVLIVSRGSCCTELRVAFGWLLLFSTVERCEYQWNASLYFV